MISSKQAGVYLITNDNNGKVYVGSAVRLSRRCNEHISLLRGGNHPNRHLQRSWDKHGADAFSFSVLEVVDEIPELIPCEQKWLDLHMGVGEVYNICMTAGSTLGMKHSEESKRLISIAHKGRVASPETLAKMSAAQTGRVFSDETRRKMSEVALGRRHTEETRARMSKSGMGRKTSEESIAKRLATKAALPQEVRDASEAKRLATIASLPQEVKDATIAKQLATLAALPQEVKDERRAKRMAKRASLPQSVKDATRDKILATKARLSTERDIMAACVYIFILGLVVDEGVDCGTH